MPTRPRRPTALLPRPHAEPAALGAALLALASLAACGEAVNNGAGDTSTRDAAVADGASIEPGEDAVAPSDDAVAPSDDALEPGEDAVAPPFDAPAPPRDVVPPPLDAPAPRDVVPPRDVLSPVDARPDVDPGVPVGDARLARALTVREVAIFQGVKIALASNGALVSTRNAPVIAGREAAVRAYVAPGAGFAPGMYTAELLWSDGASAPTALRDTRMIVGPSADVSAAGVFTFRVPAARVTARARWAVRVTAPDGDAPSAGATHEARFPRDGALVDLAPRPAAGPLRITLVPVRWTADGSNRVPPTEEPQLARFRSVLLALYPLTAVELTVHAPVSFGRTTLTGNVNFGALNGVLEDLRSTERAPDDVYYYALVAPASSYTAYCGRSCVTGQSYVVEDAADAELRVGSGVGFDRDETAWTFAHELGHLFGRYHAPCDTSGSDRAYPYRNGSIGSWGWDPRDGAFHNPATYTDFMGYCDDQWLSDYTYSALFDRASVLRPAPAALGYDGPRRAFERLELRRDGAHAWQGRASLRHEPRGAGPVTVRYLRADGALLATREARWVRLSHELDGAYAHVFVPVERGATHVSLVAPDGPASAPRVVALPPR